MSEILHKWLKSNKRHSPGEEAMLNVLVASGFIRNGMDKLCSDFGITATQYNVLRILKGVYPEGHPRCEIISRMIERAPDITRLIDRLEKQGLAERDRDNEDRRLSVTRITKKGLKLINDMQTEIDKEQQKLTMNLTKEECEKLSELCEKIYADKV